MPIDYNALRTEIDTDPLGLGYAPLVAEGSDQGVTDLLNGNKTATTLTYLQQGAVLVLANKMAANKFGMLAQGQTVSAPVSYAVDTLMPAVAKQEGLDLSQSQVQQMIGIFKQLGLLTDADVSAVTAGEATRAEVLFGAGAIIASSDVAKSQGR